MGRRQVKRPPKAEQIPRDLAVKALTRVLSDRQPLDEALAELGASLNGAPRAWLQEVSSGTLRWKGRIDLVLDTLALHKKPSGWLRKALSIAVYQLIAQEKVPPAKIVSETVDLVRARDGEAPAKFANALLRKAADQAAHWRDWQPDSNATADELAAWASLPRWFWDRLVASHGGPWAREFAQACLARPQLWLRAVKSELSAEWAELGPIPGSYSIRADSERSGPVTAIPGFAAGEFFIQDISSQLLVTQVAEELTRQGSGKRALDLCAAPGGKAAGLSVMGFSVDAFDRDGPRRRLLSETLARVAPQARVLSDAELKSVGDFDLVWVDAPCSGSGIIRRHSDVRWIRRDTDLASLRATQAGLVKQALGKIKPKAYLLYSVCSIFAEEGPQLLESLGLKSKVVREWLLCPQSAPHGDGFYAALIQVESE